jgi:hypothetical protein
MKETAQEAFKGYEVTKAPHRKRGEKEYTMRGIKDGREINARGKSARTLFENFFRSNGEK